MQRTIQKVVAVSHLEPIRAVIASGINDDGTHVRKARLDNASLSIISYDGERIMEQLSYINYTT
jgi:broad specificity phosphatase PhoE